MQAGVIHNKAGTLIQSTGHFALFFGQFACNFFWVPILAPDL